MNLSIRPISRDWYKIILPGAECWVFQRPSKNQKFVSHGCCWGSFACLYTCLASRSDALSLKANANNDYG